MFLPVGGSVRDPTALSSPNAPVAGRDGPIVRAQHRTLGAQGTNAWDFTQVGARRELWHEVVPRDALGQPSERSSSRSMKRFTVRTASASVRFARS